MSPRMSGKVMGAEFCRRRLGSMERLFNLHGTFILGMCVFNIIFAIVAALGNLLMIFALWKASSILTVVRKLFLNMAISDHAVGIFPHLMYGIIMATMLNMAAEEENNFGILCSSRMLIVCYFSLYLLACSSFLTVSAIAVDRSLGIYLHNYAIPRIRYSKTRLLDLGAFVVSKVWNSILIYFTPQP